MAQSASLSATPLSHMINRLRAAEVAAEPYPHYYLENIFPDQYYRVLLEHLPPNTVYQNLYEVTTLKLDHFRHRTQRDLNEGWTSALPHELRTFWDSFDEWFLGAELAQAVLESFAAPLRLRLGEAASLPAVSVESQLIRHRGGYFLGPHSDLHTKLVVLLLYLAPDESASHLGTSLYRPKDSKFSCPNSIHYPFEDFIRVKTVPYLPNSLLAFLRSDLSFHGVEPMSENDVGSCGRDLIQYVIYDKDAREEQLRIRRLAAAEEVKA